VAKCFGGANLTGAPKISGDQHLHFSPGGLIKVTD
jgi:hypothetical protein